MQEKLSYEDSEGDKVVGILSNPTGSKEKPIIILCHGFTSGKDNSTNTKLRKTFDEKEISTFRFDFFAHGESEGEFENLTISKAVDDVLKAIDFLKSKGYSKIGLVGSSFGGMASLLATSRTNDLYILALKSPVSDYLGKIIADENRYPLEKWEEQGFLIHKESDGRGFKLNYSYFEDAERINSYEEMKRIKIPTLIVHGDKDKTVPIEQSKKAASVIENCKLEIVEGAGHHYSNPGEFNRMIKLISEFIIEKSK